MVSDRAPLTAASAASAPASATGAVARAPACLVTGASGFVGAALCRHLLTRGWTVHALAHRHPERVPPGCASITRADLLGESRWLQRLDEVDCVVHSAGHAHSAWDGSATQRERIIAANVQPTAAIAREAFRRGLRVVLISSASVFGEDSPQPFTPGSPPQPVGPYAESKWLAEQALREAADSAEATRAPAAGADSGSGPGPSPGPSADAKAAAAATATRTEAAEPRDARWTIIRPPLVHGPGVRANFLRLMRWVDRGWPLPLGAVNNRRSLIGIDNLVDLIGTVLADEAAQRRVLLPADSQWSTPQLVRALAQALGRPARLIPVPDRVLRGVATAAGQLGVQRLAAPLRALTHSLALHDAWLSDTLGWQPPLSPAESLRRTADWFRQAQDAHATHTVTQSGKT